MGVVCYHGNAHTWPVVFRCFPAFLVCSSKMSAEKRRWVKRKRKMSRVESMLAAKGRKSSTVTVQPQAILQRMLHTTHGLLSQLLSRILYFYLAFIHPVMTLTVTVRLILIRLQEKRLTKSGFLASPNMMQK